MSSSGEWQHKGLRQKLDKLCADCTSNKNGWAVCKGEKHNCHHYNLAVAQWSLLNYDPLCLTNYIGMEGALRVIRAYKYKGELRHTEVVTI